MNRATRILGLFFLCGASHLAAVDRSTVVRWEFGAEETIALMSHGGVHRDVPGPRPPQYPDFAADNLAVKLDGQGARLVVDDTGSRSEFDFSNGDEISIEAWVQVDELRRQENAYVIGKGRTGSHDFPADNQNWALRVRENQGKAAVSFLFATRREKSQPHPDAHWHRWTTTSGFDPGKSWHHIAVSYRFGDPDSIRGWIDGRPQNGAWDMGGTTKAPPVVDDDSIWIGASRGGAASNSFRGSLDSIAIHRQRLDDSTIQSRYRREGPDISNVAAVELPPQLGELTIGRVLVSLHEDMPAHDRWLNEGEPWPNVTTSYTSEAFLFDRLPLRYDSWGIRESWKTPVLVRLAADVTLSPGVHRVLMRVRGLGRLWVDGTIVAQSRPLTESPNGEEPITAVAVPPAPGMRRAEHRQQELFAEIKVGESGSSRVIFETLVGGKKSRSDPGETCVAVEFVSSVESKEARGYRVLTATEASESLIALTDSDVERALARQEQVLRQFEDRSRRELAASQDAYWKKRHDLARSWCLTHPAPDVPEVGEHPIDAFIADKLEKARAGSPQSLDVRLPVPTTLIDDARFLRRVYLDTIGVPPLEQDVREFLSDRSGHKRRRLVDRLLADERWADHWIGYWQDVLAENPTLLNASLNTTGPFRWFVHDSLRDNKPFDRFVTELILLRGSLHEGGSSGFGIAADNEAPFAAKGQIIANAFLGIELQCARCHDSPFHSTTQRDLYSLAAMFERKGVSVPKSSRVPAAFFEEQARESLIQVTLAPDATIVPEWPFGEVTGVVNGDQWDDRLNNASDSRERLAMLVTAPENERFAQVIVNRVWRRYMGAGIVEPAHDWEGHPPSHPEMLRWLAHQFVQSGYDLKHIARLILISQAYQRDATGQNLSADPAERFFAAPDRRRLTAEQIVDSLYASAGHSMEVEELTFDPDGRRLSSNRLTLGVPRRAWMFANLANERDRPSLSLPRARAICDILEAFGWSGSRQNPRTDREMTPNVLQPGVLANGLASVWLTRVSQGSELAELAIQAATPERLVDSIFLRYLGRFPKDTERAPLADALSEGFDDRVLSEAEVRSPNPLPPLPRVTWSNHLQSEANVIAVEVERRARLGPPGEARLRTDWRETLEDVVWSVVNLREFVWIP